MPFFDPVRRNDPQLRILAIGIALGLGVLLAGLWYIQVISANRYRADLLDQSFRIIRLPAIRGNILDRNGFLLARNQPTYNIDLYLEELRRYFRFQYTNRVLAEFHKINPKVRPTGKVDEELQSDARYEVVSNLVHQVSALLQEPESLDEKEFTNHYNNSRSLPFPLVRNLTPRQMARFAENASRLPSLALEAQAVRYYPFHTTAAHLLGHIQRQEGPPDDEEIAFQFRLPDWVGKMGVERAFDEQLRGRPGVKSVLVNNLQYRQAEEIWTDPEPGENVVLTIDLPLQREAENALKSLGSDTKGAAVVLDCRNGDVLALESVPSFDPNMFTSRISEEDFAKLVDPDTSPQLDRATSGRYPPGSIFKIIVSLAGLEGGAIQPEVPFEAGTYYQIDGHGHRWKCTAPAGTYDFTKAFYWSCNCYFIDHGRRTGFERIAEMGREFGLGQRTGLTTRQESAGSFPDPNDRTKTDGTRWTEGDTANLCIGQGDITVTPLQMAVMTAAIANGGTVFEPRVVDRIEPQSPELGGSTIHFPPGQIRNQVHVRPESLALVRNAMLQDVEHRDARGRFDGTGARAAVDGMRVCGKTGTAQIKPGNVVKGYVTWFVSFAPFENPRYAVVIMVETEHGSGGGTCAPVAQKIYQAILQRENGGTLPAHLRMAAN